MSYCTHHAPSESSRRSVRSTFESTAIANGRQPRASSGWSFWATDSTGTEASSFDSHFVSELKTVAYFADGSFAGEPRKAVP